MSYIVPVDITEKEVMDFVGPTRPELSGPIANPRFTIKSKPVLFRVLTWNNPDPPPQGRRGKILQPEYDFNEIAKATDTDGILRSSRDKQLVCMMKDTWWLGGKNPRTVAYVQRRLNEISQMSPMSFNMVLRSLAKDLIEFGNFFLYLHRKDAFSSGKEAQIQGKRIGPIAAIHPIDVTTMRPVMGDTVEIRKWVQTLQPRSLLSGLGNTLAPLDSDKNSVSFDVREVIHGFAWRRTGFVFGTPPALPVLDDVRALRRLEEIAEIVSHRHAFPLVHVVVGTEKQPARMLADGSSEIDAVKNAYESMKMEGALITSERAKVTAISLKPLDLSNLLQHFTNRVVTGLGLSDVDIGRGSSANRGTAGVLVKSLLDRCKELQAILADFLINQLLDVLLAEGGFDATPENRVYLRFPEVDIDRMMAIGNFARAQYQGHAITETEMRLMLGLDPIDATDRKGMFMELIEKPLAIIKAVDEPYTAAAKNSTKNKTQPSNQHGKKVAKTLPINNSMNLTLEPLKTLRSEILDYITECVRKEKSIDDRKLWDFAASTQDNLLEALLLGTEQNVLNGFKTYTDASKSATSFVYTGSLHRRFSKHCILPQLKKFIGTRENPGEFNSLVRKIRTNTDGKYILATMSFFDTWQYSWQAACNKISQIAERFGMAQATWIDGAHNIGWKVNNSFKSLGPAQAHYHELVDKPEATFYLDLTDKLPGRINLNVTDIKRSPTGCTIELASDIKDLLDLSKPKRRISILLDNGERTILPDETSEGWEFSRNGTIRIPHVNSGIIEVWDDGRVVGKTRYVVPEMKED